MIQNPFPGNMSFVRYNQRCVNSLCKEDDLEITIGILTMRKSGDLDSNLVNKIQTLKFDQDRIFFSVLARDKNFLLNELKKLKNKNSYEFIANLHILSSLNNFKNDPEFKALVQSVNVE